MNLLLINLDGKFSNVVQMKYKSTCLKSSIFSNAFNCENALDPFWVNANDWAGNRNFQGNNWIKVVFSKKFNIVEVCIAQRTILPKKLFETVNLTMGNDFSEIVKLNEFTTCFLFGCENGVETSEITLTGNTYKNSKSHNGFNSIMAYTYSLGTAILFV